LTISLISASSFFEGRRVEEKIDRTELMKFMMAVPFKLILYLQFNQKASAFGGHFDQAQ
jgi:hypothetical protein